MQRLVSHFPSALPGFGLLTLRLVLCAYLLFDGSRVREMHAVWPALGGEVSAAAALLLLACAAFVGIGLLTPVPQLIVILFEIAILSGGLWTKGLAIVFGPWHGRVCHAAIALALAFTGPGAYSLDARLFGRREINIPPRTRPPLL